MFIFATRSNCGKLLKFQVPRCFRKKMLDKIKLVYGKNLENKVKITLMDNPQLSL